MDVTANQDEISDHETFQLEFEPSTKRWYMRTMKDKYFTLQPGGGVQANENKRQVGIGMLRADVTLTRGPYLSLLLVLSIKPFRGSFG